MLKTIKIGLGFSFGFLIGSTALNLCNKIICHRYANDDEFMEYVKENNPEVYERLKKYRK